MPLVAAIVGEGGSGGAIAIAAANRVLMLEHSVYAVISPEGCASILWRTADKAADAAEAMRVTAADLKQLGVIDRIVDEPVGGAHRDPAAMIAALGERDRRGARRAPPLSRDAVRAERRAKFLSRRLSADTKRAAELLPPPSVTFRSVRGLAAHRRSRRW